MEIGDLVYVLIGAVWLIYSFLKKGNKKTTSGLPGNTMTGDEMTEQPVEEYLPSEVVGQVDDPYETVRSEIKERERTEEELEVALSYTNPSPILKVLEGLPPKPPKPPKLTRAEKPAMIHSFLKKEEVLPASRVGVLKGGRTGSLPSSGKDLPDFDLRKAVIFYEILKRPEY